ncbi:hypothetical protein HU200_062879 [Digitaria exilis]|uniref:aldehyde oxygenase (deformylating) n=1 Tax=Digitaria exilis TaxID=1010633 RepID=A0A835DZK3_9POAL|nr:hypothetical protein HU200_062879 [Digitaria exilis]
MISFATAEEAEAALGRAMTWTEAAWFRYSGSTPDYCLCFLNFFILFASYTLAAVPIALLELCAPGKLIMSYKLQPQVRLSPNVFLRCYKDTARILALITIGPLLMVPYPALKVAGIRTGLPLPPAWEVAAQLLMYMLIEDYLGYWFHRLQHTDWFYNNIHYVHHEFKAPMGFVAAYAHWSESFIVGFASFVGMVMVPCHMTTCWLWFAIRGIVGVDIHCGFNFPFSPTKLIPFYGGAEFHDYHHYGGKWSQNNFAPVFTFCDYIYGTDKVCF